MNSIRGSYILSDAGALSILLLLVLSALSDTECTVMWMTPSNKTELILIGSKSTLSKTPPLTLYIDDIAISLSPLIRYLGVILDPTLSFSAHINTVVKTFFSCTTLSKSDHLISNNNEEAYREEVSFLTHWCWEDNLSLNVNKTKELIVSFKAAVERVSSFKFLGVHITEELTWTEQTTRVVKKAQQHLFFLRRLRRFGMDPRILRTFYTCTVESILTGSITTWYGSCTAQYITGLQRPNLLDLTLALTLTLHQLLLEENKEDSKGLHPPKPLSVLTAAEWEE
ncbi:hypothetical protein NFI96_009787, partial [Prochilodus magdalenae]